MPFDIPAVTLEWLRETHPDIDDKLENEQLRHRLGALTQTSRFLTRLLISDTEALDVVANLDRRPAVQAATEEELAHWKRLELLRIAARDLSDIDQLETTGALLADLASDVLCNAARLAGNDEMVIIGMGKLGGRELNYSSDIDVMFAGTAPESSAREIMRIARQSFRVDAALRPEGRNGPLVRSISNYEKYWEQHAEPWEFQALMKSRVLSGPEELSNAFSAAATEAVWSKPFDANAIRSVREMKARAEAIVTNDGIADREVKRGRGGIRDIEFAVQLVQLVHGALDAGIRSPTTLVALDELADGDYIDRTDADQLGDSYRFMRQVEHRLQLVDEQQTHLIPNDKASREHLASVMGYRDVRALDSFEQDLRRHQSRVRNAHERLYFRPLLEAFASGHFDHNTALATQLAAFGFTDAQRTRAAVDELTRGLARSSRLMQQLMPLLLDWLSQSPDPDEGLLGLRTLISGFRSPNQLITAFRDSTNGAQRLCTLTGTSALFSHGLVRHPELIDDLGNDEALVPSTPILERLRNAMQWRQESEQRHETLLRLTRAEQLRIAAADVLGHLDSIESATRRTELAEAALQLSMEAINPQVPVALVAMGRFGGAELSYVSDLDIIVVHGGTTADEQAQAEHIAQQLLGVVANPAPTRHLFPLDFDLRPEGKQGVLARSIASCEDYYARWASHWERQALVRARPIFGDEAVANAFTGIVESFVWGGPLSPEAIREIRMLKARMESERLPRGEDPAFHLKLGPGSLSDIEWTVQFLQLQHGVQGTNTKQSLTALTDLGFIDDRDSRILQDALSFCDAVRNRLFLVNNGPSNSLPTSPGKLTALSRSLQISDVREDYKRVTRRSRAVVEKLFYGQSS